MARAMWSGAISFGLVNIPVKMHKATASSSGREISFHQIHKSCGSRIRHVRWCAKEEREVPWDEVAKGYEVERGKYVEVTDEELDAILPEEDHASVAIDSFVALAELDPIFYDRAYYLSPDGSPRAYALLHGALAASGKVAVARVLLRTRSHLALVRVLEDHLLLETMFYPAEIVDASEIAGVPRGKTAHADKRQLEAAQQLIASMTTAWKPERYRDEYTAEVKKLVEKKVAGGEIVESLLQPAAPGGKVVDLYEALQRSLRETKLHPPARAAAGRRLKSAARRRAGGRRGSRARRG